MAMSRLFPVEKSNISVESGTLTLGEVTKNIPYRELPDGSGKFMYFKLNEHDDLIEEGAKLVAIHMDTLSFFHDDSDICFVTPEASTIKLAEKILQIYETSGLIIYKSIQPDDIDPISVEYTAVTSTDRKYLYLGKNKIEKLLNKDIIILDSICTTGGTIRGVYDLLIKAGIPADRIVEATMLFTEGERRDSIDVGNGKLLDLHAFGHLPIIKNEVESINGSKL